MSLTITLASYREKGVLRRLRATPLRPQAVLLAQVVVLFVVAALGAVLLVAAGDTVYGLRFNGSPLSMAAAFVLGCFGLFGLGLVLAGLMPTARTAQVVSMTLFYPMVFLSGATLPMEFMPQTIRRYARVLPLTHVVALMKGLWVGDRWGKHLVEVGVLAALFVAGVLVSARTFRWE